MSAEYKNVWGGVSYPGLMTSVNKCENDITPFVAHHQSPLRGDSEKASIDVHDHFLIQGG